MNQGILAARALSTVGGGEAGSPNLSARLESAICSIALDIAQLQNTMNKINGAPGAPINDASKASAVQPTAPLSMTIEHAQQCAQQLRELADAFNAVA
jgi:hypothetical protein